MSAEKWVVQCGATMMPFVILESGETSCEPVKSTPVAVSETLVRNSTPVTPLVLIPGPRYFHSPTFEGSFSFVGPADKGEEDEEGERGTEAGEGAAEGRGTGCQGGRETQKGRGQAQEGIGKEVRQCNYIINSKVFSSRARIVSFAQNENFAI